MPEFTPVIALHGGAGTILKTNMTPEKEAAYHAGLRACLQAGLDVLRDGGKSLDAVTASVIALEENPLFNAGRGAVFTTDETHEMDAAIMDGATRACGAISGICGPRNPVLAARAIMEQTEHVFLAGQGAKRFCETAGLEMVAPDWFSTEQRRKALHDEMARRESGASDDGDPARKHGTVGAVALDRFGHLAAATSTGGMTAKTPGRVGDSPVIGAGTWADDRTAALSATGHGEYFIRWAVGHEIDARMRWAGQSLEEAAGNVVRELGEIGGSGGLVAVDRQGNISLPFNSPGMYRAWCGADGTIHTGIY
ncbi:isoaspartyl peptidase/L-asparaginase-like protein (Ntn-hydrolase superfamily) [Ochrobactrum daejeonense]|uniref:Isoaspartyl peptidase n=1 Tax=Brucella daejeonensis TaxID=659015 RepID=A0A7W9AZC3_9HYPH|nr:isoaspartyl peptidase/L-asparaginase [Brucella daejeonensis]MBB5703222.1 isoaspartyl peptidase/L-asparaginase-like protein (Ntn-hydrolase superfamily) [Brucella daejeonensis]NKB80093.1 isoaspartyl peptidase/L-asparaginase [Brucella daejeonensis]